MTRSTAQRRLSPQAREGEDARAISPRKSSRRMAAAPGKAPLSDTESEKPVRERLQKATLAAGGVTADSHVTEASIPADGGESTSSRGRLQRKRSFEEVDVEGEPEQEQVVSETGKQHSRKRSRDGAEEEAGLSNGKRLSGERSRERANIPEGITSGPEGETLATPDKRAGTPEHNGSKRTEATVEAMASPKIKRSRLHSTAVEENGNAPASEKEAVAEPATNAAESAAPLTETSAAPIPPTSGFANTSATSPFGALQGNKSPIADQPQTSDSAFASSAFGSLATSSTSGFGAIGKSTGGFGAGGGFGSGGKSPMGADTRKENDKPKEPSSSAFGGALGQTSAFAAAPASRKTFGLGYGMIGGGSRFAGSSGGGGFGTLGGGSDGLSTFASSSKPLPSLASSSKAAPVFGAPAADDDEGGDTEPDESAGFKSPLSQEEDKQDERFYEQQLSTGEEEEETTYACRAKVYNYTSVSDGPDGGSGKKEWRERGLGVLRLNVRRDDPDGKPRARFLMRADGSHRVVLNTPVKKEISFGAATGGPPQGGYCLFMGTIEGKTTLELLQLKVSAKDKRLFRPSSSEGRGLEACTVDG